MHELASHWTNSETSIEYRGVETLEDDAVVSCPNYLQRTSENTESPMEDTLEKDILDPIPSSKYLSSLFLEEERSESTIRTDESTPRSNDRPLSRVQTYFSTRIETCSKESSRNPIEEISEITNEIR
jgi:hypothetical protein